MRDLIDIIEADKGDIPAEVHQIFCDWQLYYSKDGAWDTSRHDWQGRLISLMVDHSPALTGFLYRGTVIGDKAADLAITGQRLYVGRNTSLLESWTKSRRCAGDFAAEHDSDSLSIAVIRQQASLLDVVLDAAQIPESHQKEREVLVKSAERAIDHDDIIAIACCRYDAGEDTTYHIAPNLLAKVSFDVWHAFIMERHHA